MGASKQRQGKTIASSWISEFSLILYFSHDLKTIIFILILLQQFKITKTLRGKGTKHFSSRVFFLPESAMEDNF